MANKTTLTPAEHANVVQATKLWDTERVFSHAAPSTGVVLAKRIIREPQSVEEIVVQAANNGSVADSVFNVKKNGTTIMALDTTITVPNADPDGTVYVFTPVDDAHALLAPGDILTIESGASMATGLADLSIQVRIAKVFASSNG